MDDSLTIDSESYTRKAGYQPQIFRDLDQIYQSGLQHELLGNRVPETIRNIVIMHGQMLLSRDLCYSKAFDGTPFHRYFFSNFIVYAKASLDMLAVVINQYCDLRFSGGDIDFHKRKFVAKVTEAKPHMQSVICSLANWITELVTYRNAIIHHSYSVIGYRESDKELIVSPKPELGLVGFFAQPSIKPGKPIPWRKVAEVFDDYILNTRKILELIFEDIYGEFKKAWGYQC